MAKHDVREFVQQGLDGVLSQGRNGHRTLARIALAVPVKVVERNSLDAQPFEGSLRVPSRDRDALRLEGAVRLRQDKPKGFPGEPGEAVLPRLAVRGFPLALDDDGLAEK